MYIPQYVLDSSQLLHQDVYASTQVLHRRVSVNQGHMARVDIRLCWIKFQLEIRQSTSSVSMYFQSISSTREEYQNGNTGVLVEIEETSRADHIGWTHLSRNVTKGPDLQDISTQSFKLSILDSLGKLW